LISVVAGHRNHGKQGLPRHPRESPWCFHSTGVNESLGTRMRSTLRFIGQGSGAASYPNRPEGRAAARCPRLLRPQLDRRVAPPQHAGPPRRQTLQEREIGGLALDGGHERATGHDADPELARVGL
jgi:hypothetical protein